MEHNTVCSVATVTKTQKTNNKTTCVESQSQSQCINVDIH